MLSWLFCTFGSVLSRDLFFKSDFAFEGMRERERDSRFLQADKAVRFVSKVRDFL